ncbi:MAG TPA: hypothetical protein VMO20_01385 [Candidatus Acidoferrum sp.]|nr:hypothetical protein [Candidatus Acidoferrum sp.]
MANCRRTKQRTGLLFLFVLLLAPFVCPAQSTNLLSRLEPVPPFPELRAAAKTLRIPLDGIHPVTNTGALAPGDSVTALITLHQKGNRRSQWLVYFKIIGNTNSAKPEKPLVLYTSTGSRFEFPQTYAAFRIRSIGPYVDTTSIWGSPVPKDKSATLSINEGFLGLGMDKGAAAIYHLHLARQRMEITNFDFDISEKPFKAERIARDRKLGAQLQVTPDEERAMAGWYPAMYSYFDSVGQTPNLDTIMLKVIRLPSLWSIVKHAGIDANFEIGLDDIAPFAMPAGWDLPSAPVYKLPLSLTLNGEPAINAMLFVTDPHPPLLTCGGIIGFLAEDPVDKENYMTLRIISARSGESGRKTARPAK